jgi:hypothetical protein
MCTEHFFSNCKSPAPDARGHQSGFDLRGQLYRITGVDLTRIDGIEVQNAQTIVSEVGVDMSRWKTEKHFASWLGLCPDNRSSGGKVLKRGTRHVVNRASTALRLAASALLRSQSALGAKFRRLRSKLGAPKAITAMAHMLARLVYRMLKFGHDYVDRSDSLQRTPPYCGPWRTPPSACTSKAWPEKCEGYYQNQLYPGKAQGLLGRTRLFVLRRDLSACFVER